MGAIDLSNVDPKAIKVVSMPETKAAAPSSAGGAINLDDIHPDAIKVVSYPKAPPEGYDIVGAGKAAMRGITQGATLNFGDEAYGLLGAVVNPTNSDKGFWDRYHESRDYARRQDAASQAEHPYVFGAGEIGGGIASTALGGAALKATGLALPEALTVAKGDGLLARAAKMGRQGAILGAAAKSGSAKEFTDIPEEALKGAATGYAAGYALPMSGAAVTEGIPAIGKGAAYVVGGVKPSTVEKYVAGSDRINALAAQGEDAVKDAVDSGVAQVMADKASMGDRAGQLENILNQGYAAKQAELAGAVTPLSKAKEMVGTLQAQKAELGALSEQADAALVQSGATFQKQDLLRAIDKIGTSKGAAIGDEAHAALSKLQTTRDRIAEQLPDEIPAVQMRDVLKQLRRDVNFDQSAGEFNDTLNGMRKDFTAKISGALKKASPQYDQYMERMSDMSDSLATMNRYFGDESRALGSLETLRKGGAKAQLIEDALTNHATVNGDQSMLQHLAEIRQNQALLGRIKEGEDLRPVLFPRAWNALQEAQAESQMASDVADPIARLTQNRTQSVIRNQGGTVPNIEDRRALEALGQTTGTDYGQMISDKNVADAFKKGNRTGARMTALGAAVGGGLGHLVAGPMGASIGTSGGAALGATLDMYGPALVKRALDANAFVQEKLATSEGVQQLGPYAKMLMNAARQGNEALTATNAYLLKTDPNYGKVLQLRTDINQRRDAVKRRIGE